jgi:RNA-binding protein
MSAIELTPIQRKAHKANAHHLKPVAIIGQDGLTPGVRLEIDKALNAHGLIKIRVLGDDREQRHAWWLELADTLQAAPIAHLGKLLILWRSQPEKAITLSADPGGGPRLLKVLSYSKQPGRKPRVKRIRVLGNQRLTPGGHVRKAKKQTGISHKKRFSSPQ